MSDKRDWDSSVALSSYEGVERDGYLSRRVPSHAKFRNGVSSLRSKGDRSKTTIEDHLNCPILVNSNGTMKFRRRQMFIKMVSIGMCCR